MENFSSSSDMWVNVHQITFIQAIYLIWIGNIRYNAR